MAKYKQDGFVTMIVLMLLILAVIIGAAYLRVKHAGS
jgi:hypothetical protein